MFTDDQIHRILAKKMSIVAIAAVSANNIIGRKGDLVIHNPEDMAHFKHITMGYSVVMGMTTYKSLTQRLYGRTTIVLTHDETAKFQDALVFTDLEELTKHLIGLPKVIICGGGQIYKLFERLITTLWLTRYDAVVDGDVEFPINLERWAVNKYADINGGAIYNYFSYRG
jgi:dihydrofolate reductase